jgi:uncharacterized MAPEG superfamily protein
MRPKKKVYFVFKLRQGYVLYFKVASFLEKRAIYIYIYIVEQPPKRSMLLFKATEKLNFRPLYFIEGINNIFF